MAKYTITRICGHEEVIQVYGKEKERPRKIQYEEGRRCTECTYAEYVERQKEKEEQRKQENAKAAEEAKEQGLPTLSGTPRQVEYGETMRKKLIDYLESEWENVAGQYEAQQSRQDITEIGKKNLQKMKRAMTDLRLIITSITTHKVRADWWIETVKNFTSNGGLLTFIEKMMVEIDGSTLEPAADLLVVRPDQALTETVAEISFTNEKVMVYFPERLDELRHVVKSLGYSWALLEKQWERDIDYTSGQAVDRAAEVAHHLLKAGIIVRLEDDQAREKAIAASYEQEHKRWIWMTKSNHTDYPAWFYLLWSRADDCYDAARKIKGSKYLAPGVVVPTHQFEEVADFAKRYDFKFTPIAESTMKKAASAREQTLKITPMPLPERENVQADPGRIPPKLEVPEEVGIDASLRDED